MPHIFNENIWYNQIDKYVTKHMERVIHISQNIRFKETFGNTKKKWASTPRHDNPYLLKVLRDSLPVVHVDY